MNLLKWISTNDFNKLNIFLSVILITCIIYTLDENVFIWLCIKSGLNKGEKIPKRLESKLNMGKLWFYFHLSILFNILELKYQMKIEGLLNLEKYKFKTHFS